MPSLCSQTCGAVPGTEAGSLRGVLLEGSKALTLDLSKCS